MTPRAAVILCLDYRAVAVKTTSHITQLYHLAFPALQGHNLPFLAAIKGGMAKVAIEAAAQRMSSPIAGGKASLALPVGSHNITEFRLYFQLLARMVLVNCSEDPLYNFLLYLYQERCVAHPHLSPNRLTAYQRMWLLLRQRLMRFEKDRGPKCSPKPTCRAVCMHAHPATRPICVGGPYPFFSL